MFGFSGFFACLPKGAASFTVVSVIKTNEAVVTRARHSVSFLKAKE